MKMQKNILLVEDNFLNRRLIKKVLVENNYNVFESKNADEALEQLMYKEIHLLIIDINLGENNSSGIELGAIVQEKYKIPFIYLTAYDTGEIVTKAVQTKPKSYITKPFKKIDLLTSVEIAFITIENSEENNELRYLTVKEDDFNIKVLINDIEYFESEGNYLLIHSAQKTYKYRSTIKQVLEILPDIFIQTHRAFIVNKNKIEKYSPKEVIVGKTSIPLSKKFNLNIEL